MQVIRIRQICYAVILLLTYVTAIGSGCPGGCSTCTYQLPDNNTSLATSITTCTNCSDGFFIGQADDKDIRSRISKAHQKEIFGSPTSSGMMCYECSWIFEGCEQCKWNDVSDLTCTSCKEGFIVVSYGSIEECHECSKVTDDCEQCELIEKKGACTSCREGYVIGYNGFNYQERICEKCTELVDNCEICEWKDSGLRCTRCLDGYKFYNKYACDQSSLMNSLTIAAVVVGATIGMLANAVGILRLYIILQRRTANLRGTVPSTKCDKTWMTIILIAVCIIAGGTVVVPLALTIKQLTNWLRHKCYRRRTTLPTEDIMYVSVNDQNDETGQDTRRKSIEMNLLNENGDSQVQLVISVTPGQAPGVPASTPQATLSNTISTYAVHVSQAADQAQHIDPYVQSAPLAVPQGEVQVAAPSTTGQPGALPAYFIGGSISYYPEKELGHGSRGVVYKGKFGRQGNRQVAVKVIKCTNEQDAKEAHTELKNIYKEIVTMETLMTPADDSHIIHFLDSYDKNNNVYLVFELAIGTLVEYNLNAGWQGLLTRPDVFRSLVAGLKHIHTHNIVHRDLKPGNIFIVERNSGLKAVIGDFGQAKATTENKHTFTSNFGSNAYIAPEVWRAMLADKATLPLETKFTKASDVFSLGLVGYYTLWEGKHPFGNENTAQESISKGIIPNFHKNTDLMNWFAYEDMLKSMLNNNPDDRLSIEDVSAHPALWTSDKIIKYFTQKSDEFESQIKTGALNDQLLEDRSLINGQSGVWMNLLPINLKNHLRNYKFNSTLPPLYKGMKQKSIIYFLRAIRNTTAHYKDEYPKNAIAELGPFPDGHVQMWLTVCPKLLMHVYRTLGPP